MLYIFLVFQQESVKGPKGAHHLPPVCSTQVPSLPLLWKPWQGKDGTDSCHDPEMQKPLLTYFQEAKASVGISHASI